MTEKCSILTGFRTEFWHFRCNSDVSYYAFISVESDGIDCVTSCIAPFLYFGIMNKCTSQETLVLCVLVYRKIRRTYVGL